MSTNEGVQQTKYNDGHSPGNIMIKRLLNIIITPPSVAHALRRCSQLFRCRRHLLKFTCSFFLFHGISISSSSTGAAGATHSFKGLDAIFHIIQPRLHQVQASKKDLNLDQESLRITAHVYSPVNLTVSYQAIK